LRRGRAKIGSANRSLFRQETKEFKNGNTRKTGKTQKFQNVLSSGPTSSSTEASYKQMKISRFGQKRQTPPRSLFDYSNTLLPLLWHVIFLQSLSYIIPLEQKRPLVKSGGIPDKFIQNILVTHSYSRNKLETKKNEKKNIFGDSFGFSLVENDMKYETRNDMKSGSCNMKRVTAEPNRNEEDGSTKLPPICKKVTSNAGNLKYYTLTMGKVKRFPPRGNSHCPVEKPTPCMSKYKFNVKEKTEDLANRMEEFETRRSQHREVREHLTHVITHYKDPEVIERAEADYEIWTTWEKSLEDRFSLHLASLETEFENYLKEQTKKMKEVAMELTQTLRSIKSLLV